MTDSMKGPPPLAGLAVGEPDRLYDSLGGVLQWLLERQFGIPAEEGQWLVREVFMVYRGLSHPPSDARSWLIAGACHSANVYLEARGLAASGADVQRKSRAAEQFLLHDEAVELLPERDRTVLRLRFEEGKSYAQIAAQLGVTVRSAERIVSAAAAKLRGLIRRK